jgi:hypothetical protein
MQRSGNKQLNSAEVKEEYEAKISNKSAALENLDKNVDINRASENIRISKLKSKIV